MATQFENVEEIAPKSHIYYVDPDSFDSGYSISWGDVQPRSWGDYILPVYIPDHMQGNDIDRDLVAESNFEVWQEEFSDSEGDHWVPLHGGHGSYGIAVRLDVKDDEIIETLAALQDYPLISEEDHSRREIEGRDEAWERWVRSDFTSAIEKKTWTIDGREAEVVDFDEGTLDLRDWFERMAERYNEEWIAESGGYIDVESLVNKMDGNDIKEALLEGAEIEIQAADAD